MPVAVQIMRAESLTEVPVIGRLLTTGVAKRSGPAVPDEVLAARSTTGNGATQPAGGRDDRSASVSEPRCPRCGHPGVHHSRGDGGPCEGCDRCWAEEQRRERPPHHSGPAVTT